jgi:polar amino acid transport system ATP-binding protein
MKILIENLTKKYQDKVILNELTLDIPDHAIIAFLGPSGSGKSTLLRLIAGLESFESGKIQLNDHIITEQTKNLESYRKEIGFVFQDHNLFDHLTVFENIALVLEKVHRLKRIDFEPMIVDKLKDFNLCEHKDKYPHQLSGGQAQRVSIVRALCIQPKLILLDEPTSSLDPVLTYDVLNAVKHLAIDSKDFIIVTHEIGFAKNIADYIVFMDEGRIIEHGPKTILENPQTKAFINFLSKVLPFNQ